MVERLSGPTPISAKPAAAILLFGDTGTGKKLVARAVHALAGRAGAFVAINGALPNTLAERAVRLPQGAFSGATQDRLGLIRSADRGTLFLDEIGDLAAASQATLLRVLQEREVHPVGQQGGDRGRSAGRRGDAPRSRSAGRAGPIPPRSLRAAGAFTVCLPPLRARIDDLGLLLAGLLARDEERTAPVRFVVDAACALLRYGWPSNIRELGACLIVATALARSDVIRLEHLPEPVRRAGLTCTAEPQPVDDPKRAELIALLVEHGGNVSAVARAARRSRAQRGGRARRSIAGSAASASTPGGSVAE